MPPLILTLAFDADTFARLDALRRAHFPPELNRVPAHVTLFHALPGGDESHILDDLERVCAETPPFEVTFPVVRSLGRGVALDVSCPPLLGLRKRLTALWAGSLTTQDRQGYRPHVTVQNKVTPDAARELLGLLGAAWQPQSGRGEGLTLWRYLGGPWDEMRTIPFAGSSLESRL